MVRYYKYLYAFSLGVFFALIGLLVYVFLIAPAQQTATANETPVEKREPVRPADVETLLAATNEQRTKNGLPILEGDSRLNASAQEKCDHMVKVNYNSHYAPDGTGPSYFIDKHLKRPSIWGENLANVPYSTLPTTGKFVVVGWMGSPEHRKAILSDKYKRVGFGICESQNLADIGRQTIFVQHFAD